MRPAIPSRAAGVCTKQITTLGRRLGDGVEPDRRAGRGVPDQPQGRRRYDRADDGRSNGSRDGRGSQGAFSAVERRRLARDQAITS